MDSRNTSNDPTDVTEQVLVDLSDSISEDGEAKGITIETRNWLAPGAAPTFQVGAFEWDSVGRCGYYHVILNGHAATIDVAVIDDQRVGFAIIEEVEDYRGEGWLLSVEALFDIAAGPRGCPAINAQVDHMGGATVDDPIETSEAVIVLRRALLATAELWWNDPQFQSMRSSNGLVTA